MAGGLNRPKIAFLTARDPLDRRTWSGLYHYMRLSLERHCGPVEPLGPLKLWQETAGKVANRAAMALVHRRYDYAHSSFLAKRYGRIFSERLRDARADVVFAPAASTELAYLSTDIPVVYLSDVTVSLAMGYYAWYSDLLPQSARDLVMAEKLAVANARASVYSTAWAADSAVASLGLDPRAVHAIPFGANIDDVPPAEAVLAREHNDRCRLLFIGVDWERKGGSIAHAALLDLIASGVDAQLTVCGCVPPPVFAHERMRVIPFLDKNHAAQRDDFRRLMRGSDFLLLPTRAEAFGIVFCEASAFGLPSITTKTGGVPDVVRDGVNGYTLPMDGGGADYAKVIARIFSDRGEYDRLSRSSRAEYDRALNWDSWGRSMKGIFEAVMK
jgi:glycosyltransferase involved in cell wall biosynthesis